MRASLSMMLDTTWANQLRCSVEVELDNPHELVAGELFTLMVGRMRLMGEQVRVENERAILRNHGEEPTVSRERQAFEELQRERETEDRLAGKLPDESDRP